MQVSHLPAHKGVYDGVVGRAGLGEEGGDDGDGGGDHALLAKRLQHGHHGVRRPAHQVAENHQQEHRRHFFLIAQDLNDLHCLQVFNGPQLEA